MNLNIPSDISEDELVDTIASRVAESLGIHPSEVDVEIDMESGEVTFTVKSDDFLEAGSAVLDLANEDIQEDIASRIEDALPEVSVEQYEISDEITATVEFAVNANDAENNLSQAEWRTSELLSEFEVEIDSNIMLLFMLTF